jgi:hypothetical protein
VEWGYIEDFDRLKDTPGGYELAASMPALVDLATALRQGRAAA